MTRALDGVDDNEDDDDDDDDDDVDMRMIRMMRIMWMCDQSLDARARPNFSNNLTDHRLHPYHHQHGAVSE